MVTVLEAPVTETEARSLSQAARAELPPEVLPATRPERVLIALRHFASAGGFVCQTTGTLAQWLGVSTETVRRGIADLLRLGGIERTGLRRGKAVQYRIVESPQGFVESPQPSAARSARHRSDTHSRPLKGGAVGRDICGDDDHSRLKDSAYRGSPMSPEDRAHLDNFKWTPELRAEYAARAQALALRYSGDAEVVAQFDDIEAGTCDDCRHAVAWRGEHGQFKVCRPCLARRHSVSMRLRAQTNRAVEQA